MELRRGEKIMSEYANPEVLVTTEWVASHLNDPNLRLIEVDVDTSAYEQGHVPGAVGWNWQTQLQDTLRRDLADQRSFSHLAGNAGITPETTVILYGDNNNWFAAWAFWQMKYYGHKDVRLMNGGRKKWLEEKRGITTDAPKTQPANYAGKAPDTSIRAKREDIFSVLERRSPAKMVDVRSADEFTGKVIAPPGMTETAQRGGHIPGAANVPWSQAVAEDGTFKPADALRQLYAGKGITGDQEVIAYCRIGERSSHTWFVLKYLLGYKNVRNYDGSWTEWGNLVGAPIEKEAAAAAR
jgi:thiosulfate/3-mercaptopyruvate sulfurtransferase